MRHTVRAGLANVKSGEESANEVRNRSTDLTYSIGSWRQISY